MKKYKSEYVPAEHKSAELCMEAVKQNGLYKVEIMERAGTYIRHIKWLLFYKLLRD
ncbi:MAG: hypothetical protein FWB99_05145 [Treponema sp.]|nr:hypothetical protein [Treponema sp.]